MSAPDSLHNGLPEWTSADAQEGRRNAQRLAQLACDRGAASRSGAGLGQVERVGICGAGIMGAAIAAVNVQHRVPVRIFDAAPAAVDRALEFLQREFLQRECPLSPAAVDSDVVRDASYAVGCYRQDDLIGCDLVIESVVENRELKQEILGQLAGKLGPNALLASNTSTIPIDELATALSEPGRFLGLHFCNPVSQRRLVEIVRGGATDDRAVAAAVAYVARIGKLPIVVRDTPGFLVNRLLLPYLNEALEMVCQGADLRLLDQTARDFGMAMGPIELFDMIGTDTAMWAGRTLWEAFPDRIALTPVLPALVKRNRLGQKTGLGFYRYEAAGAAPKVDPGLEPILTPYVRRAREFTRREITLRLFLPMLIEATRAIEEGVVQDVRDVDIGLLYGLAFPEDRGGLLYWADHLGAVTTLELLKPFESLGKRMQPTALLMQMAETGQRFYQW